MGASDMQTMKAIIEAERYPGPSIIIAYSHCIAHGYNMKYGLNQQKNAVDSGYWPLFRYDPTLQDAGKNPFQLDSKSPKITMKDYAYNEMRYLMLAKSQPKVAKQLMEQAQRDVDNKWITYQRMAGVYEPEVKETPKAPAPDQAAPLGSKTDDGGKA